MHKKILLPLMAILFAIPVISQTVELVDVPDAKPGTVTVVMNMSGFTPTKVGGLTLYVDYDPALLTYTGFTGHNNGGSYFVTASASNQTITVGWITSDFENGSTISDGPFLTFEFNYTGGTETTLSFLADCEIDAFNGVNIMNSNPYHVVDNPTGNPDAFISGTITPVEYVGTASLTFDTATPGDDATVPLTIGGFAGKSVSSIHLQIGYDTDKLSFNGLGANPLNLLYSEVDGVITLSNIYPTPITTGWPRTVELEFTYNGLGYAPVWFIGESVIGDPDGNTLHTELIDDGAGVYQLEDLGILSIAKVTSEGAGVVTSPFPPYQIIDPDPVTVTITAEDLSGVNLGMVNLVIEYDEEKLTYTGPFIQSPWTITHEPGQLTLTRIATGTGFTLDGTIFTMNFDYYALSTDPDPLAEINFATGTLLQRTGPTFNYIAPELEDGFVSTGYELDVKVFLEGPYKVASGKMETDPIFLNAMPLSQPYNIVPWSYAGTETVTSIPAGVVDWILVELRDANAPANAIPSTQKWIGTLFLKEDGSVVDLDGVSAPVVSIVPDDNIYVIIHHRNHIGIMSAVGMTISGGKLSYDFTIAEDQAFDGGVTVSPLQKNLDTGIYGMFAGEFVIDGVINLTDVVAINGQRILLPPLQGYNQGDLIFNGVILLGDVLKANSNRLLNIFSRIP